MLSIVYTVICAQEIITDMKEMVKGMMRAFYGANHGVKPEHFFFYRDGVSEGQFQTVSVVFCSCMWCVLLVVSASGVCLKLGASYLHSMHVCGTAKAAVVHL